MEKDLISIIIPVYNVEEYLDKCLESVINQTYNNIEIILVDDGSTDNSGKICDKYEEKDSRVKVIHKENGGQSEARNIALDEVRGKYVAFVDSDDYIKKDYIEYLYNLILKYECKMSICAYYIETEKGNKYDLGKTYSEKLMNTQETLSRMLCDEGFTVSPCAKMYDISLFKDIRYPVGKIYEDNETTYKLIKKCENVAYGNESKYSYIKRKNSTMNSKFNERKLDLIEITDKMAQELIKEYPNMKDSIERRVIYARFSILRQAVSDKNANKNLIKKLRKEILTKWKQILTNRKTSKRDKIAFFTLLFGINFFKFSWELYCKIKY